MGDWDAYCALCAAPFSCYDPFREDGAPGDGFDPEVIGLEEMAWLENILLVGFNPNAPGLSKCFVTGPAEESDYGSFNCEAGSHPNAPLMPNPDSHPRLNLQSYTTHSPDEPSSFPIHADCLRVFTQAAEYQIHGKCNTEPSLSVLVYDALWAAMSKSSAPCYNALLVDYGELAESARDQFWEHRHGHEAWVTNPFTSPQISSFLSMLPDRSSTSAPMTEKFRSPAPTSSQTNPFATLAKEINCEILLNLPYASIQGLVLSGLLPFHLPSISSFWKRKLHLDMPFLWDLLPTTSSECGFALYQEMRHQCLATTPVVSPEEGSTPVVISPRDRSLVLGLANRRRVWTACQQLAELYEGEIREIEQARNAGEVDEEILKGSTSVGIPIVAAPVSTDVGFLGVYLVEKWTDMQEGGMLNFYFESMRINGDGKEGQTRLCGVERVGGKVFGVRSGEAFGVVVPEGVWIRGFVFNLTGTWGLKSGVKVGISGIKVLFRDGTEIQIGSEDGDKRLMTSNEGSYITGFTGEFANGVIQRLGLLHCPRGSTLATSPPIAPSLQRHLWKTSLPPAHLQASPYQTGYWQPERSYDTIPMSFLLFSTTFSELSNITGFSSDANLRTFGVHFTDGSGKVIGHPGRHFDVDSERKVFNIDGPGGEVVNKVEVGMNHLPMAIKLTTSRNRICFFGTNQKNNHIIYEPPASTHFIAGIYASWGYDAERKECTTISLLTARRDGEVGDMIEGVEDGSSWSPPGFEHLMPGERRCEAIAVAGEEDYEVFEGRWW